MNNTRSALTLRRVLREIVFAAALGGVIFAPGVLAFGQALPPGAPDFVGLLKASPGVLGVETAAATSGKQVIFAWFQDKKAALAWFYSPAHQRLMGSVAAGAASGRAPMADVPDDGRPILVIASLTIGRTGEVNNVQMPVSQIAIELYAPLPGGFAAGGRFAPSAVTVPGLIERSGR
jgi:hypothetical protein